MLEPAADTDSKRKYYLEIAEGDPGGKQVLDEHHSHFILVNDSIADYGKVHSPSKARGL